MQLALKRKVGLFSRVKGISSFHFPYSLDGNRIRDTWAGMLADALKVNQSLQSLRSATDILGEIWYTLGVFRRSNAFYLLYIVLVMVMT